MKDTLLKSDDQTWLDNADNASESRTFAASDFFSASTMLLH